MHLTAQKFVDLRRLPTRLQTLLDLAHLPLEPLRAEPEEGAAPFVQGRGRVGSRRDPGQYSAGEVADFRPHPRVIHVVSFFHQPPDRPDDLANPAGLDI